MYYCNQMYSQYHKNFHFYQRHSFIRKKYMKLYNTQCFIFKTLHTNFKLKQVSSHIVMPKVSTSFTSKIDSYVREFPKEFKKTPRNELYCTICNTTINHERRSTVVKHQETSKHITECPI